MAYKDSLNPALHGEADEDGDDTFRFPMALELEKRGVFSFSELMRMKNIGWNSTVLDTYFRSQRDFADRDGQESVYFARTLKILEEIDANTECVPRSGRMSFLDVGCCPGSFATYVLRKNPMALGYGMSLPTEQGGHRCTVRPPYIRRFDVHFTDITYLQLGPAPIADSRLEDFPAFLLQNQEGITVPRQFDLVLLDCHHLRKQVGNKDFNYWRIIVSQLIIGLSAASHGGTVVMKLSNPHRDGHLKILYLFDSISSRLVLHKPVCLHATRGTFYAVAKGVGQGAEAHRLSFLLLRLKELWFSLTFGGEDGGGRWMTGEDLDFIVTIDDAVTQFAGRLVDLAGPVWSTQLEALQVMFRKRGVHFDNTTHDSEQMVR